MDLAVNRPQAHQLRADDLGALLLERWLSNAKKEPMRESRFTDKQIVAILREADRTSVAETAMKSKSQRADDPRLAQAMRSAGAGRSEAAQGAVDRKAK